MPFHPESERPSAGRLLAIAALLVLLGLVYLWSLRAGRERALEPPDPTGGAATTVAPPAPPVGPTRP